MINQLIYHNSNKILVGTVEKAGSSTVIATMGYPVLGNFLDRGDRADLIRREVWKEIHYKHADWAEFPIRIAIIRDPVERLISCYRDKVLLKNVEKIKDKFKTFSSFVNNLDHIRNTSRELYTHSNSLVGVLGPASNYTKIIKLENLSTEFVPLVKQISGNKDVPDIRININREIKDILPTNENIKKIKEYYKDDYKEYGEYFT